MSMTSELDLCIGELRTAAQSLAAVADSLTELFSSGNTESDTTAQQGNDNRQIVTLEQVRAVLADKSRSGHTAEARELLERYGATRLSEIDPAKYAELLADAEVLGDG